MNRQVANHMHSNGPDKITSPAKKGFVMQKTETPDLFLKQYRIDRAAVSSAITKASLVLFALSLVLQIQSAKAAGIADCEARFETLEYDPNNTKLHYRYQQIETQYSPDLDSNFAEHRADYVKAMKNKRHWYWGARQFNQSGFSDRVTERMYLLWNREPSPEAKAAIGLKLQEVERNQQNLPDWRELTASKDREPRVIQLLADAAPKKDGQNVKKKEDLENWNLAMQLAIKMAQNKRDLTKEDLAHFAVVLQGHTQHPSAMPRYPYGYLVRYLVHDDLNFMYTKTPSGRRTLDPLNTFISGTDKYAALEFFIGWLRKSRTTMHPVIAAARARQFIVSVHPLWDSNGRLARIVANYVLMRAGYPPAYIPRGTETENVSVALFPLRDFKDQISPEESIQIMLEGVLRSQRALLE